MLGTKCMVSNSTTLKKTHLFLEKMNCLEWDWNSNPQHSTRMHNTIVRAVGKEASNKHCTTSLNEFSFYREPIVN